jgi:hypothetical protein
MRLVLAVTSLMAFIVFPLKVHFPSLFDPNTARAFNGRVRATLANWKDNRGAGRKAGLPRRQHDPRGSPAAPLSPRLSQMWYTACIKLELSNTGASDPLFQHLETLAQNSGPYDVKTRLTMLLFLLERMSQSQMAYFVPTNTESNESPACVTNLEPHDTITMQEFGLMGNIFPQPLSWCSTAVTDAHVMKSLKGSSNSSACIGFLLNAVFAETFPTHFRTSTAPSVSVAMFLFRVYGTSAAFSLASFQPLVCSKMTPHTVRQLIRLCCQSTTGNTTSCRQCALLLRRELDLSQQKTQLWSGVEEGPSSSCTSSTLSLPLSIDSPRSSPRPPPLNPLESKASCGSKSPRLSSMRESVSHMAKAVLKDN